MSYTVHTTMFSGPFDLLLRLVTKKMVDIAALSITEIADQYVAEVTALTVDKDQPLDLDVASDFLLVASTLLEIKSRALLGYHEPEDPFAEKDAEDVSPEDAREILIARLIAYKQFRDVAAALGARLETESKMHVRTAGPEPEYLHVMPDYVEHVTIDDLARLCAEVDARREEVLIEANHIAPKRIPVALAVRHVDTRIQKTPHTSFSELLNDEKRSEDVVVLLLALLELYKFGSIKLHQKHVFEDIDVDRIEGAPVYTGSTTDYDATNQDDNDKEPAEKDA